MTFRELLIVLFMLILTSAFWVVIIVKSSSPYTDAYKSLAGSYSRTLEQITEEDNLETAKVRAGCVLKNAPKGVEKRFQITLPDEFKRRR